MSALKALEAAQPVELVITRITFPDGQPHGVALARMARLKRPEVKVLFVARDENREHTEGLGKFLAVPITAAALMEAVEGMLAAQDG